MEYAVSCGADRGRLLTVAGVSAAALADPDHRIALPRYIALLRTAAAQCDDPAFALHFGEAVRMQDISIVGLICEAARTPAEVGRQLNRYARLVVDSAGGESATMVDTVIGPDGLWMQVTNPVYVRHPEMIEAELARLVCNTRAAFAANPDFQAMRFPLAAHFTHPDPGYRDQYERIFAAPLKFGAARNALLLDPAFAKLTQPPTNAYVFGVLSRRADALLNTLQAADTLRARVESLLMPILHTGEVSLDFVADRLGFSRRTLSRRLNAEGVSFEKLVDGLRHNLALHYLDSSKVSVNETAYLLGFSEPSAFSRAFKRWTGNSPRGRHTV